MIHNVTPTGGDDTSNIQSVIDSASSGDTVLLPGGLTFLIDPTSNTNFSFFGSSVGLVLNKSITLQIDGTLQSKTVKPDHYVMILVEGNDVTINGKGKVIGDRDTHVAADNFGQWGFGIALGNCNNVKIGAGLTIEKLWGDGITIIGSKNVSIDHTIVDSCFRQNISVIDVDGLTITNNTIENAKDAGIDLESDTNSQTIQNVLIQYNSFTNSGGPADIGVGSSTGTYKTITINNNQHDMKMQPIWVHDNAGTTGISPLAATLRAIFYEVLHAPYYRFWFYPTSWSKV